MTLSSRNQLGMIALAGVIVGVFVGAFAGVTAGMVSALTTTSLGFGYRLWTLPIATKEIRDETGLAKELHESEERLREAFQHTGIGMAIVDEDARWLRVNPALCEIFGYSEEELRARTCHDITHAEDLAFCPAAMKKLRAGEERFCQVDKRYVRKDGSIVWAQVTLSLITASHSRPQFVVQVENITRRRELDENLARSRDQALETSRLKSEFLAGMSHEIRTPMNAVIGMSRLLEDTPLSDEQRQMNEVVQQSAQSLLNLLNDILDFSKIEAGSMRLDLAPFDPRQIARESLEFYQSAAEAKGLELIPVDFTGWPERVLGDANRVRQVLNNLIGNAIKFTARGSIALHGRFQELGERRAWRIEISDTGIGIPQNARARVFQTFTQVDGSNTRRFGGTGLGLAISRHLLELMGGSIGFESEAGVGSTFWFELPLPVARGGSQPPLARRNGRHRVLVAEDNVHNQMVMKLMLKKFGCHVDVVTDGIQVLERLAARNYDAVVMDCQMPQLDGYEATRRIRSGEMPRVDPRIPIIAVTAFALDGDRQRCLDAGMTEYVSKPVHEGMLCESFARCGLHLERVPGEEHGD